MLSMPETEPTPTAETPVFMRDYRNPVDAQWRVTVPADWRFAERVELFIRMKEDHLVVLTRLEVERFRKWASEIKGPDRTKALAEWARTTDKAKVDSAGRITLPSDWAGELGIEKGKKVVLVGAVETFQIWPEKGHDEAEGVIRARGKELLEGYD
jgi:DNA-binding transcriptional regulator/RsmH inhibitor MraZ